ncbi:MAG: hypothetical protein CR993_00350 [Rhodobacterales bacterium]|nr:MAG: hypothetical protein CR993_00350 [Rhodobacterales bacterium]
MLNDLERFAVHIEAMERMVALMKADVARFSSGAPRREIVTGFSRFLSGQEPIAPLRARNYKAFAEGLWASVENAGFADAAHMVVAREVYAGGASVSALGGAAAGADIGGGVAGATPRRAVLRANPVITGRAAPKWVHLEAELEHRGVNTAALELEMLASAEVNPLAGGFVPQETVFEATVTLRCFTDRKRFEDFRIAHLPLTTVPMKHRIAFRPDGMRPLSAYRRVVVLLALPPRGAYAVNLYDFALLVAES